MTNTILSRRRLLTGGVAALTLLAGSVIPTAFAHDVDCPVCKLKVVQDTKEQDNEVALRYGRKRIEYRCVQCALTDVLRGTYKDGDLKILAPSETKGRPVVIERTGGKWSAPAGTIFVAVKDSHKVCHVTYRAFTSKTAFDAYVAKNQPLLKDAKPVTLDQLVASAR